MENDIEQLKNTDDKGKPRKPPTMVRTSRVLLFLLGANLLVLFTPRIGVVNNFAFVNPVLSLLLLFAGIALCIYALSTMYYIADGPQK
jgi:hypothetical protein